MGPGKGSLSPVGLARKFERTPTVQAGPDMKTALVSRPRARAPRPSTGTEGAISNLLTLR
jgi:hypothetical protein